MCMDVKETEEAQWDNLRGKTRNMIRKSHTSGLVAVRGFDNLDEFYDIYLSTMLEKKILPISKKMFGLMEKSLGPNVELITAHKNGIVVGGIIVLFGSDIATYPWQACLPEFREFAPNQFLIWEALKSCRERGIYRLDMGESTVGGSVYSFKKNFGGVPQEIYYHQKSERMGQSLNVPHYWSRLTGKVTYQIATVMANNSPHMVRGKANVWLKSKGRIV